MGTQVKKVGDHWTRGFQPGWLRAYLPLIPTMSASLLFYLQKPPGVSRPMLLFCFLEGLATPTQADRWMSFCIVLALMTPMFLSRIPYLLGPYENDTCLNFARHSGLSLTIRSQFPRSSHKKEPAERGEEPSRKRDLKKGFLDIATTHLCFSFFFLTWVLVHVWATNHVADTYIGLVFVLCCFTFRFILQIFIEHVMNKVVDSSKLRTLRGACPQGTQNSSGRDAK